SSASTAFTTASFSEPGTYLLQLSASDGTLSGSAMVTVFVGKLVCARSNAGTDFWLVLANSSGDQPAGPESVNLNISGDVNTSGTVTIPDLTFAQSFTVTAGQTTTIILPSTAVMRTSDQVE